MSDMGIEDLSSLLEDDEQENGLESFGNNDDSGKQEPRRPSDGDSAHTPRARHASPSAPGVNAEAGRSSVPRRQGMHSAEAPAHAAPATPRRPLPDMRGATGSGNTGVENLRMPEPSHTGNSIGAHTDGMGGRRQGEGTIHAERMPQDTGGTASAHRPGHEIRYRTPAAEARPSSTHTVPTAGTGASTGAGTPTPARNGQGGRGGTAGNHAYDDRRAPEAGQHPYRRPARTVQASSSESSPASGPPSGMQDGGGHGSHDDGRSRSRNVSPLPHARHSAPAASSALRPSPPMQDTDRARDVEYTAMGGDGPSTVGGGCPDHARNPARDGDGNHRRTVSMPHAEDARTPSAGETGGASGSRQIGEIYRRDRTPESMTGPEAVRARHGRLTPRRYRMRGPDRTKRVRRDHIGAVTLSDPQERIIDRVNREYSEGKAFVPTDTDRRIWDYLALFRFATRSDVVRVGGWHGGYARQAPRIVRYGDLGLIIAERVPLSTLDYIQLTHDGMIMSSYDFLPDPSPTEATRGDRSHSLGLSSLASQLLTPSREYDQPGHDLLGVGDREWADLRAEIRRGDAKVIGETIYRSAWSRMRSDSHARGRSQSAVTDPRVATLMGRIFREWKSKGGAKGDTLEWVCADPESRGEFAWLWMIYGGEAVRGGERDTHGRPRHIPPSERATDERGKIIPQPGDDIITRDHPPDMVIARHRTPGGGRPRSLAIELELTGKSVADYKATMSSYMSGNGKILYSKVIWLVVQASVANMIRTGATWAGAVEGRDYIIAPVSNEENRSKDEFYDGLDMRPGSFKRTSSGNAYGYAIISSLMNEMDREKEERE